MALVAALAVLPTSCRSNPSGSKTDAGLDALAVDGAADGPVDASRDTGSDGAASDGAAADGAADAAPNPFSAYRWAALPAPLGAPIGALAFDSEGVLYVGAGGGSLSFPGSAHAGIFKSTDEGASWRAASLGVVNYGTADNYGVAALASAGTTMYAGTVGVWRSTDRGASWQQKLIAGGLVKNIRGQGDLVVAGNETGNPLYVSTDAGDTFRSVPSPPGGLISLEVLAGGSVILRAGDTGVLRSTDRGVTFNAVQGIANGPDLTAELRCDGVATCYASAHVTPSASDVAVLLKSTDAGATWTPLSPAMPPAWVLAISDTGSVYVERSPTTMARSDDGGSSFNTIPRPTTTGASEPDCAGPLVARGDKLFAGCFDGVHRSIDKGQHWQPASGSPATGAITGAALRIFVDTSPTALGLNGDIYVNGAEGRDARGEPGYTLKRSSDDGRTWQTLVPYFGSGPCIATPVGALECQGVTLAPFAESFTIGRSDNHGVTWRKLDVPAGLGSVTGAPFLGTYGSVAYAAGVAGVARSTDDGLTFQLIPNSPSVGSLQVLRNGHLLATMPPGTGAAGYRSIDQGATWQAIDRLNALPVVEDAAGRLLYYTGNGSLQVSTDEAATWTLLSSNGIPFQAVDPLPMVIDGAGHLFLFGRWPSPADQVRIFASADGGTWFTPMPAQIPNPNGISFATDKRGRLLVGTAGGVFRLESDAVSN